MTATDTSHLPDLQDEPVPTAAGAPGATIAAALSGQPKLRCATRVPPVVRVRELAAAQSALFAQLDRMHVQHLPAAAHGSERQVRALGRRLRSPALDPPLGTRPDAMEDTACDRPLRQPSNHEHTVAAPHNA